MKNRPQPHNPFDSLMLGVLSELPPIERKKLLLFQRLIVAPSAYALIDSELAKLEDIAIDPDWLATVRSDPKVAELPRKLAALAKQMKAHGNQL